MASSPHIFSDITTRRIMLDVVIALLPATLAGAWFFGARVLLVSAATILSCVCAEYASRRIMKRDSTIGDLSAVVTGLLLSLNLPPSIEIWKAVVGGAIAIVLVKQIFGGIGQNFMNPALTARVMLLISWGASMTRWTAPGWAFSPAAGVDAVSSATPLALAKTYFQTGAGLSGLPSYASLFAGSVAGCIGETSAIALLLGGAYLLAKKVITWHIPAAYIATAAATSWAFGGAGGGLFAGDPLRHALSGGLLIGAIFMATDYSTSPMTKTGKLIMGVGCGLLTTVIRLYTGYPEGVSFSILIMNVVTPLIDKYTVPRAFGAPAKKGAF
ncbi:MAG: RnfABCDGE type electron transport complex subunit D [Clostridiales bacterium]|nr:RnfABCDGE type electron transport complex subunit D [Clostridiales bacterium]